MWVGIVSQSEHVCNVQRKEKFGLLEETIAFLHSLLLCFLCNIVERKCECFNHLCSTLFLLSKLSIRKGGNKCRVGIIKFGYLAV